MRKTLAPNILQDKLMNFARDIAQAYFNVTGEVLIPDIVKREPFTAIENSIYRDARKFLTYEVYNRHYPFWSQLSRSLGLASNTSTVIYRVRRFKEFINDIHDPLITQWYKEYLRITNRLKNAPQSDKTN
jgi:hypothetical protein